MVAYNSSVKDQGFWESRDDIKKSINVGFLAPATFWKPLSFLFDTIGTLKSSMRFVQVTRHVCKCGSCHLSESRCRLLCMPSETQFIVLLPYICVCRDCDLVC